MFILASHIYPVEGPILSPGALEIQGNRIRQVGPVGIVLKSAPFLDLKNHVLLPGFVNAHCHLELTALGPMKTCKEGPHAFVPWIRELVSRKNKLTREDMIQGIREGIRRLMQSGVTAIGDHISFNTPWEEIVHSPLRGKLFGEVLGILPQVSRDIYQALKKMQKEVENSNSLFGMHVSPHSVHAVHPDTLSQVFNVETGPLSVHLAESREEAEYFESHSGALMDFVRERYDGKLHEAQSGFQWIKNRKHDPKKIMLVHGNYLSGSELDEITQEQISIVHCPGSHEFFGHQPFHLPEMLERRINVAIGTDSIASNMNLDFLDELGRIRNIFPDLSVESILRLATLNGAKALKMDKEIGSLTSGKKADIVGFQIDSLEQIFKKDKADFLMIDGKRIF